MKEHVPQMAEDGKGAYLKGEVGFKTPKNENKNLFEEIGESTLPLATFACSLTIEQQRKLDDEILNPHGLTVYCFEDEDLDSTDLIDKLNQFFDAEGEGKKQLAKEIAAKLSE